jgi:23S rRNA pseudouridine1911/1915/1917 synthase
VRQFRAARSGRADELCAEALGVSRRSLQPVFERGDVRVSGRRARKGDAVAEGDLVEIVAPPSPAPVPQPELPLEVLWQDEALVAVNKPPGMASHPLEPGERGTLASALVARFPECVAAGADPREAGLVHRLDDGTSGVLLAARSRGAWEAARAEFRRGAAVKTYLALVEGEIDSPFVVDLPIAHDRARGGGRVGGERAQPARTEVFVAERRGARTLVRCVTRSGRVHQVRVHLAASGHPVVGDTRYGGPPWELPGFFLHAGQITLVHPVTGDPFTVTAPLPGDRVLGAP